MNSVIIQSSIDLGIIHRLIGLLDQNNLDIQMKLPGL